MSHLKLYMEVDKFKIMYKEIDSKSLEDKVDSFWAHLLHRYFYHDEFIINQNARPTNTTKKKADFIIRAVSGPEKDAHVILVEDKRASLAGQDGAWSGAVEQLTGYMIQSRDAEKRRLKLRPADPLPYSVYGIVNVGRHSRFYVLDPRDTTLKDLPGTDGKIFQLKDDARAIAKILTELCAATLPDVSSSSGSSSSGSANSSRHASPSRPGSSSGAPGSAAGKAPTSGSAAPVKKKKTA